MSKIISNINKTNEEQVFSLEKKNYIVLAIGFAIILLGYILMAGGKSESPEVFNEAIFNFRRITLAPVLIIIGFIVEIFGIMWYPKKS